MFLDELDLRNNLLEQLKSLILPSLQTLYLTDNRLNSCDVSQLIYLPNLKVLNLDSNRLAGYGPIWHLLKHSNRLEIVKYDDN
jgi:Leucine-rich repeat (LRR) protein